jgi:hypothetical protein
MALRGLKNKESEMPLKVQWSEKIINTPDEGVE